MSTLEYFLSLSTLEYMVLGAPVVVAILALLYSEWLLRH